MDGLISNPYNNCKGYRLLNKPLTSLYLYDYWWYNKLPIILKEAKSKKKGVFSEVEASPPPVKFNIILIGALSGF